MLRVLLALYIKRKQKNYQRFPMHVQYVTFCCYKIYEPIATALQCECAMQMRRFRRVALMNPLCCCYCRADLGPLSTRFFFFLVHSNVVPLTRDRVPTSAPHGLVQFALQVYNAVLARRATAPTAATGYLMKCHRCPTDC